MSTRATTIERLAPRGRTTATDTTTPAWQGRRGDLHDALPEAARRSFAAHPVNHSPRARTNGADTDAATPRTPAEPSPAATSNAAETDADQAQMRLDQARLDQDPTLLCANLALCVVEILAGARALDQIGRWVTDGAHKKGVLRPRPRGDDLEGDPPLAAGTLDGRNHANLADQRAQQLA